MSTFSVINTNDSGSGSLQQAISDANALAGKDTINFDGIFADNVAHTINVSFGSSLLITDDLSLEGTGADLLTISAASTSRIFEISSGVTAQIAGLTITNSYESYFEAGGGIYNAGTLALNNITFSGNAAYNGGAIYNSGTLTLNNTDFSDNQAYNGGAIYNSGTLTTSNSTISEGNSAFYGSGIYSTGTLTLNDSTISNNNGYQGVGIYSTGTLTLNDSIISDNSVTLNGGSGGGIITTGTAIVSNSIISDNFADYTSGGIDNSGILTINDSIINDNQGRQGAGGISNSGTLTVSNSIINGNSTTYYGSGGGIYNYNNGIVTISNSTISDNNVEGGSGGGIYNVGSLTLINSTIRDNLVQQEFEVGGGGIYNSGILNVTNSTISGNQTPYGYGGGIYNDSGSVTLINGTISGNSAGIGGGIFSTNSLTVINSTIAFNIAYDYDNGYNSGGGVVSDGTATIKNSIIAGNNNTATDPVNPDVVGNFTSNGFNLIGKLGVSTGFNLNEQLNVAIADVLDPVLRDNGGAVKTHALVTGSRAIDTGNNADVPLDTQDLDGDGNTTEQISVDGRGSGYSRFSGDRVDIGAFEATVKVINGTINSDTITGTAGNDIITGYQGRDILRGGAGADAFVYTNIQDLADTISDFEVGIDKVVLRPLFRNLNLSNLNFATAVSGGYLYFQTQGSNTIVLIDPDASVGQGRPIKFITLNNVSVTALNNAINFAF